MECPLDSLEEVRRSSPAGHLLNTILDLDSALEKLSVPWNQLTAREWKGLQVLWDEREKRRKELDPKPRLDTEDR